MERSISPLLCFGAGVTRAIAACSTRSSVRAMLSASASTASPPQAPSRPDRQCLRRRGGCVNSGQNPTTNLFRPAPAPAHPAGSADWAPPPRTVDRSWTFRGCPARSAGLIASSLGACPRNRHPDGPHGTRRTDWPGSKLLSVSLRIGIPAFRGGPRARRFQENDETLVTLISCFCFPLLSTTRAGTAHPARGRGCRRTGFDRA